MQFSALCFDHCYYRILWEEINIGSLLLSGLSCKKPGMIQKDILGSKQENRNHYKYSLNYRKGISLRKLVIPVKQRLRRKTGEASISQIFHNSRKNMHPKAGGTKEESVLLDPQAMTIQHKLELQRICTGLEPRRK